jgi:hypothetical protein
LPDSVYLAYALKTLGLNLRLVGEHDAAIAALERAERMFRRVEGEASAEADWCGINRAAVVAMRSRTPADLRALVAAGERYLGGDNRTFERVVRLLLAETAADFGDSALALRHLDAAAAIDGAVGGTGARMQALRLQLAWAGGREVSRADLDFIDGPGALDEAGITRARLLRVLAGRVRTAEACERARAAWAVVDPLQAAWDNEQRALAGCR